MLELKSDEKATAIERIKSYFLDEFDQELGDLAAGLFVDFIEKEIGCYYYNRGIEDSKTLLTKTVTALDEEFEVLKVVPLKD